MQKHEPLSVVLSGNKKKDKVSLPRFGKKHLSLVVGISSELPKVRRPIKHTISPKPFEIWHLNNCETCIDILKLKIGDIYKLQHYFKFCTTYSIYFFLIKLVEKEIGEGEDKKLIEENPSITYPKRAQSICQRAGQKWENIEHEFSQAAELSNQLIRPDQSAKYNCDDYENHLKCLLVIAQNIKGGEEILKEIENVLLPYNQPSSSENQPSSSENLHKQIWEKTFANIKHEINDDQLIETLRKTVRNRTVIPEIYECSCHGSKIN